MTLHSNKLKNKYLIIFLFTVLSCLMTMRVCAAECGLYDNHIDIQGDLYEVREIEVGELIEVGIIYVPGCSPEEEYSISFEIDASGLDKDHLHKVFVLKDSSYLNIFPYSVRGLEMILNPQKLTYKIHSGVNLHIRDEFFIAMDKAKVVSPFLRVKSIRGKAYIVNSSDTKIKSKLSNFFSSYVFSTSLSDNSKHRTLSNGAIVGSVRNYENYLPRAYAPKIQP